MKRIREVAFIPVLETAARHTVASLAREIWLDHYLPIVGEAQIEYMLEKFESEVAIAANIHDEGHAYYLVETDHQACGYFAFVASVDGGLKISKLYVTRAMRGTGIGRKMLSFIEEEGRRQGTSFLWLTVNKANPTVETYERLGFVKTEALVTDIGSGFVMDDYRMEKKLVP